MCTGGCPQNGILVMLILVAMSGYVCRNLTLLVPEKPQQQLAKNSYFTIGPQADTTAPTLPQSSRVLSLITKPFQEKFGTRSHALSISASSSSDKPALVPPSVKRTKGEVRRLLVATSQPSRAEKRQKYIHEAGHQPQFSDQTFLEQKAVWDETAKDYVLRMIIFMDFVTSRCLDLGSIAAKDLALTLFLNEGFQEGWEIADATKNLAAMVDRFPDLSPRHCLARARRALQGWKNLDAGRTRPPLHWYLIAQIALTLLMEDSRQEALIILYMFETYCRPTEAFKVLEKHLTLPVTAQHYVTHLHASDQQEVSKVGIQDHSILLDGITMPWLGKVLEANKIGDPEGFLFRTDYVKVKRAWDRALKTLKLPAKFAVLYQIRHSGPSWDMLVKHRSLPEIKRRGQWASDFTVKRYENHALVSVQFDQLTDGLRK